MLCVLFMHKFVHASDSYTMPLGRVTHKSYLIILIHSSVGPDRPQRSVLHNGQSHACCP